jgi:CDP-diacylglycerol--glycerol-3-phosphate 3-phosphatidyltransferase
LAVITDAVDGYVARVFGQKTTLGSFLDPLADKCLLLSAFICLTIINSFPAHLRLPAWVLIIVISRDAIIVVGTILIYIITQHIEIIPSRLGKVATFFQMLTVIGLLLQFKYSNLIWSTAMLFTITSGINYIRRGSQLLNSHGH